MEARGNNRDAKNNNCRVISGSYEFIELTGTLSLGDPHFWISEILR